MPRGIPGSGPKKRTNSNKKLGAKKNARAKKPIAKKGVRKTGASRAKRSRTSTVSNTE